jgi:hypothetical protein
MSQSTAYIVGDKTNGYVVFDPVGAVVYTFDPKTNLFGPSSPLPPTQAPAKGQPAPQSGITGNAKSGVVYFSGTQLFYLTDIGNRQAVWKQLKASPLGNILGICGDLVNGIVVHDGDNLAQIKDVFNNPTWQTTAVSPRIPIQGIAGDGSNGLVVYRGSFSPQDKYDDDGKFVPTVYKFSGQPYTSACPVSEPQIQIDKLFGDGSNGYLAFGENQLFSLDPAKGVWNKVASLCFTLGSAIGNPKDGVVAIIGADNFLVMSPDCKQWSLAQAVPAASQSSDSSSASSSTGAGSSGTSGSAAKPGPAPAPAKTGGDMPSTAAAPAPAPANA